MTDQKGFTLMEIVVGFALLSSILVVGASSYASISKLQQNGATVRNVQQTGRYALEAISRDIRGSGSLQSNSSLCLSLLSTDPTQNTITYTFQPGELYRNETAVGVPVDCGNGGTKVSVGDSRVTNVTFVVPPTNSTQKSFVLVEMDVAQLDPTITSITDPNKYSYHMSTAVTPRGF